MVIKKAASKERPQQFVEYSNIENWNFSEFALTKSEVYKLLKERLKNLKEGKA
jgi:hypothetical protein